MKTSVVSLSAVAVVALAWIDPTAFAGEVASRPPAPLFDGLGPFHHTVSTRDALAQRYFNQGLMFLYGFNHKEAVRSFEAAARLDPNCAMAWWGVAFAHGPNINAPMEGAAVSPAWNALQEALRLKPHATPRERAYIDALATRYSREARPDRAALDLAYAAAMQALAKQFPDDLDASVLFADAVMNTMAWDYWLAGRTTPKPATVEVLRVLDTVLARDPQHPGANHAYIHLVEAGPEPWRGLASADRLRVYAPDAGHLVHMPSHIYLRTGRYHEATLVNEEAARGDRGYIAQCQIQGFYPGVYYPHNLHFIWYALSFEGRGEACIRAAQQAADYALSPLCGTDVAEKPRLGHLPLLAQARFGRWDEILGAADPGADRLMDRAMWHYARALAFAGRGEGVAATRETESLDALAATDAAKALDNPYLPATSILTVARHVARAKAAEACGDTGTAITELQAAVAAEQALPYMEPAFWYHPTRQSLGATLLRAGRAHEAEEVLRADLQEFPRNGWSLFALAASLREQQRHDEAALVQRDFEAAWQHADTLPDLRWF